MFCWKLCRFIRRRARLATAHGSAEMRAPFAGREAQRAVAPPLAALLLPRWQRCVVILCGDVGCIVVM